MVITVFGVGMLIEEPQDCDKEAATENEKHLNPLVVSLVELTYNDLAAGNVDESTSRDAHEDGVDNLVTFGNLHADNDAEGRDD